MEAASVFHHLIIFILFVVLGGIFWVMLSMCDPYGHGDQVFLELSKESSYFYGLGIVAGGTTVLLVILDVLWWKGCMRYIAWLLIAGNVALYYLTALAGTQRFPASPIAVYFTVCPIILYLFKVTVLRTMDPLSFLWGTGWNLMMVSAVSLGIFLAYAFGYNNFWSEHVKVDYYVRLQCVSPLIELLPLENATAIIKQIELVGGCDEAFLFWVAPIVLVLFSFAMGGAVLLIVHSQRAYAQGKGKVDLQVRAFLTFLMLGFLGLWCASGIGGANTGMSSVVFAFTFLMMVIGCTAIVFIEGINGVTSGIKQQPLIARVIAMTHSDWIRGLLVVLFFPLFFVIIPLAFLNQLGRKHLPMTKTLDEDERKLLLSIEVSRRLSSMRKWHWTSVLTKIIWWGVIFFSLSVVGARFINVFFSWLEEEFSKNGIGIAPASGIFIAVGLICFLLPPIPGVPVYIACSVILVPVCLSEGWDFWASWIYCSFIALVVRLLAVCGVQVAIGQWFGSNSVAIRRTVGVNSVEIRAIKKILMTKGLTVAKVACLCGGPDWPMCVTAGILRTSLIQNLLGSLPIFFIILPVTLSGALLLRVSEGGAWHSAATMALAVTGLVQTINLGLAMYYIEKTVQEHGEELAAEPPDEEVKKFDEISNKKARARSYVSEWHRVPILLKLIIIIGVVTETASAYLFQLFGSKCFVNFAITDNIARDLQGDVFNLVKPLGWVGIGLFGCGCVVLIILGRWISWQVRGDFKVPEAEEQRQRRMSEAGIVDDEVEDEVLEAELAKEAQIVPAEDSKA